MVCLQLRSYVSGRPLAVRIFNSTLWYMLLMNGDHDTDWYQNGCLCLMEINPTGGIYEMAAHLAGASHDLTLGETSEGDLSLLSAGKMVPDGHGFNQGHARG